ncbi:hypothetical protein H4S02_008910 [Coemansia sp. RSA 2611]|nr:hypothetical protein H4S02_008910 [Coemansia sp. RSA 2611]
MKLGFAALVLAIASAVAQPIASPDNHVVPRASFSINRAKLSQAININSQALSRQRVVINEINSALSKLHDMSGTRIEAARRAHRDAVNAQKKAMEATQRVITGLKRLRG